MKFVKWNDVTFTTFISPTKRCVYLYKDYSRQLCIRNIDNKDENIINVGDDVADTSLTIKSDQDTTEWTLYILTNSGHLYRLMENQVTKQSNRSDTDISDVDNQEIFDTLLKKESEDDLFDFRPSSESVFELASHQAVLKVANTVHSLAVSCDLVVIVTSSASNINVEVYPESLLKSEKEDIARHLPVFCHKLPKNYKTCGNAEKCLTYFIVSDLINTGESLSSDALRISLTLFKNLFGSEPGLLNSPILLICTPDGAVYSTQIKSVGKCQIQPKVLCHLICQVVGIHVINCSHLNKQDEINTSDIHTNEKNDNNGLIICAENGRCITVIHMKEHGAQFVPIAIPGPVKDCSVNFDKLYHSDGTSFCESILELNNDNKGNGDGESIVKVSRSSILKFVNVQKIVCLPKIDETISKRCSLLCQLSDGDIRVIDPKTCKDRHGMNFEKLSSTGQRIRDLLQSIEKCNIENKTLNNLQDQQSHFINQMSIASFLLSEYKVERKCIFKTIFKAKRSDSGLVEDFHLSCKITNGSSLTLSHDWGAMVTIKQNCKQTCDWLTHCIRLQNGFRQNETVNLCVPLTAEHVYTSFTVIAYLTLNVPELLRSNADFDGKHNTLLPVQICEEIIDILYFLQDESLTLTSGVRLPPSSSDVLYQLVSDRPVSTCFEDTKLQRNKTNDDCSMTVFVPAGITKNQQILENGNDEVAILKYFLKDTLLSAPSSSKSVSMVTMVGDKVLMNIKRSSSSPDKLEINIRSGHTGVCAAVRLAILHRLQKLDEKTDKTEVPVMKLKSVLHEYQGYMKEFQQLKEKLDDGLSAEGKERLIGLYQKIRQKDVLSTL